MKSRKILLLCLFVFLTACQQTNEQMTDAQRQEIANEIKQRHQDMWTVWEQNQAEKVMSFWDVNTDEAWVDEPITLVNRLNFSPTWDDVKTAFENASKNRSSTNLKIENDHVAVFSQNYAIQVCGGKFTITGTNGNVSPEHPMTITCVWSNKSGEWKILHQHWSWTTDVKEKSE